ncbi:MAG: MFS transporter [Chloroflexota bacterium]
MLLVVGLGSFMSALDGSVVNTVLPVIRQSFGSSVAEIEWVVTVYLLVVSGLLLTFGRLGDLRGHKLVYSSGFAVFVLGSGLCARAPSAAALIASRGLQALGAAMLFANAPAILTRSFSTGERGRALGMQATMTYLGLTVGPSLGGWLADRLGWSSVFTINLPIGLLAFALSLRFLPADWHDPVNERFDIAGALTFLAGLVALLLALNQGHDWGWTSPTILGLLVGAVLLLAAFVAIERRVPSPMLDLGLFGRRLFAASSASALLNYIGLYSIVFLLPFYLIQGRGLTPSQAGLLLTAQPLVMAAVAPLSGALSDRIDSRLLSTAEMGLQAVGMLLLSGLGPEVQLSDVAVRLLITGLGIGIFISPNTNALMGSAPRGRQGIASGVLATARNVGMVIGVGIAGALFTTVLARYPSGDPTGLFAGVRLALRVAAGVAALGVVASQARGEPWPEGSSQHERAEEGAGDRSSRALSDRGAGQRPQDRRQPNPGKGREDDVGRDGADGHGIVQGYDCCRPHRRRWLSPAACRQAAKSEAALGSGDPAFGDRDARRFHYLRVCGKAVGTDM